MQLQLGCGDDMWGQIRIDSNPTVAATHVYSLELGILPISDNVITEVRAWHVLEHIWNIVPLMSEIFRVCVEGATLDFLLPYYTWRGAVADPTHIRLWNEQSFEHYQDATLLRRLQIKTGWMEDVDIEFIDHDEARVNVVNGFDGRQARTHLLDIIVQFRIKAKVRKGCKWS